MPATIRLNSEEIGLLHAARWELIALYLKLRCRMDFRTGLVGSSVRVSYQALREDMYQQPEPGVSGLGSVSRDQIKRWIQSLARIGLLEIRSIGRQLILLLTTADYGDTLRKAPVHSHCVPKQAATKPHQGRSTDESKKSSPNNQLADSKSKPESTPSTQAALHLESGILDNQPPTTPLELAQLHYPAGLLEKQRLLAIKYLSGLPLEQAQAVLDELAAALARNKLQNPLGYLRVLAEKARQGRFTLEAGLAIQAQRQQQQHAQQQREQVRTTNANPVTAEQRQAAQEHLAALRAKLLGKRS